MNYGQFKLVVSYQVSIQRGFETQIDEDIVIRSWEGLQVQDDNLVLNKEICYIGT
jgi:hypothetical protein